MLDQPAVRPLPRRRPRRLAAIVAAMVIVAIAAPAIVLAATFTDVPPSSTFYAAVEKLAAARITGGCAVGKYCPKDGVTREQMAAFLTRTGGTGEQGEGAAALSLDTGSVLAQVTIKAGDLTGGTAYVQLIGTFGAFTDDADGQAYPYKAVFVLAEANGPLLGNEHYVQIDQLAGDGFGDASGAVQVFIQVPTGVNKTFQLVGGQLTGTDGLVAGYGTIDALYVPFSAGGGWTDPDPERAGGPERSLEFLRNR